MRITIISALIVLLVAELGLRLVEDRVPAALEWDDQFTQDKADQIDSLDSLDLVVIGSSVANAEIDAATIAAPGVGYNAALPAKTPRVWAEWFDDVIAPMRPSTVVVAVDLRQYNDNKPGAEGQKQRYLESEGRLSHVSGEDDSLVARIEDSLAITRLKSRIREPDKFFAAVTGWGSTGDWRDTNLDDAGRYTSFDHKTFTHRPDVLGDLTDGAFRDFAVGGVEQEAVERIVAAAQAWGAAVFLVDTPSMRTHLASVLPNGESDFDSYERSLTDIAAAAGIPLFSYEDLDDQEEFFADYYHMNLLGTEEISARIRRDIEASGES